MNENLLEDLEMETTWKDPDASSSTSSVVADKAPRGEKTTRKDASISSFVVIGDKPPRGETTRRDAASSSTSAVAVIADKAPPANPIKPKKQKQSTIPNFSARPVSKTQKHVLDDALLRFVVKDMQAFSIVDQPSFRELMNKMNPGYSIPTRKTLSNTMMANMFGQICGRLRADLADADAVCLTTDAWTSENTDSYIAVTCHYVHAEDNMIKSALLTCFLTTERHTSANLAHDLQNVIREWDLQHKVVAIVTDNAANIVSAVVDVLKKRHIPCFAHTLNLAVQDGLQAVSELCVKVKEIVGHFKRSTVSANKLAQTQKERNQTVLKLKQCTPTRWNSALHMFTRLLEVCNNIYMYI